MKLHERIAHWRHAAGLSQVELARKCSVSPAAVGQWETGTSRPGVWRIPKLALVLGVTVDALIEGDKQYEEIRNALGVAS